jgi:hypothetical protein
MTILLIFLTVFYTIMGIFTYLLVDSIFLGVQIWHAILIILFWPMITIIGILYLVFLGLLLLILKVKQLFKHKK